MFPKIEVRFQHLTVESFVHVGSRALPTIPNFIFNMTEVRFVILLIDTSNFLHNCLTASDSVIYVLIFYLGFVKEIAHISRQEKKVDDFR